MKKIIISMFLALSFMQIQAQNVSNDSINTFNKEKLIDVSENKKNYTYQAPDKQPEFPGGMKALMKYLRENMKYPQESKNNKSQGKTFVDFVVNTDGSLSEIAVIRSSGDTLLDREALRLIKNMPKWKPGKRKRKAIRVRYLLPVTFRLR